MHISLKETQAGYLTSLYFKNIYLYLAQNKYSSSKDAVRQIETQAERYLLFDSLLFRIQNFHDEQKTVLCIPKSCLDHILDLFHNSLFGAHQGSLRTFFNNQTNFLHTKFNVLC